MGFVEARDGAVQSRRQVESTMRKLIGVAVKVQRTKQSRDCCDVEWVLRWLGVLRIAWRLENRPVGRRVESHYQNGCDVEFSYRLRRFVHV
jgi:hypothetical protein